MALDFPNAPALNQVFTAPNGTQWMWDGVKWIAIPTLSGSPFALTPYVDAGDAAVNVAASHNIGRNFFHNPLINVNQRGLGPFTIVGATTSDRWLMSNGTGDTMTVNATPITAPDRVSLGDESIRFALGCTFTGAANAGSYVQIVQRIESVLRLSGKTITVSFYANSSVSGMKIGVSSYINYGTGGSPSASVISNGQSVTLGTTPAWSRQSVTLTLPSIAGKAIGTNNDDYTQISIWFSSGSTNAAAAGNVGVQSGYVGLWGLQCELGSTATPLERPDPQQDLAKCQRFYQFGYILNVAYAPAGGTVAIFMPFPVPMRSLNPAITPSSITYSNASSLSIATAWVGVGMSYQFIVTAAGTGSVQANWSASADL